MQENMEYPLVESIEIWNFMLIKHACVFFDEKNIINLKGYNNAGKSAVLRAVDVLISNLNPNMQVDFINDQEDYFRIMMRFKDGVTILRDKYRNGQSLYEMYRGNDLLFSTKKNGVLTKVMGVPEPVAAYLGILSYDNYVLNSRSCFQKALGVETSGSENYKVFNSVLKSEELARATAMLNNDKNSLISDIQALDHTIESRKYALGDMGKLDESVVLYLESHDSLVTGYERRNTDISGIASLQARLSEIQVFPELSLIDSTRLDMLESLQSEIQSVSGIKISVEVPIISGERYTAISRVYDLLSQVSEISIYNEVSGVSNERFGIIENLAGLLRSLAEEESYITGVDEKISQNNLELKQLQESLAAELASQGKKTVTCPNCGELVVVEE